MFKEEINAVGDVSKTKAMFLKNNPLGYLVSSMLAGAYVGFGMVLIFTISGVLTGQPYARVVMGVSFGVALSLVVMAGSELFTGNNFVMTVGTINKKVTAADTVKLWSVCYIGNWIGSILFAVAMYAAGILTGPVGEAIANTSASKMSIPLVPMFFRGVLCNILVCLAVWCAMKLKTEAGKLIMIFWCLFTFITSGYEHSIANMSLLTMSLLSPLGANVSIAGYFYNIIVVTIGNMVGGILFVAVPYCLIAGKQK